MTVFSLDGKDCLEIIYVDITAELADGDSQGPSQLWLSNVGAGYSIFKIEFHNLQTRVKFKICNVQWTSNIYPSIHTHYTK